MNRLTQWLGATKATRVYDAILVMALTAAYYFLASWGLKIAFENTNASPVWPASGIGFAALFIGGYRLWPGIWWGAFAANAAFLYTNQITDLPVACFLSFFIAIGNTLESVLAVFLLHCFVSSRNPLLRIQDIFKYVIIALISALASATTGSTVIGIFNNLPWPKFKVMWLTWWLGDVLSILIIGTFFLALYKTSFKVMSLKKVAEGICLFAMLIILDKWIFGGLYFLEKYHFPLSYLILPVMVWLTYRFSHWGTVTVSLVTFLFGIHGTMQARGPFFDQDINLALLLLQIFIAIVTITGLVLAAALRERQRAEEELRRSSLRFQALVENTQDLIALIDRQGQVFYISPSITRILGYPVHEYNGHNFLSLVAQEDKAFMDSQFKEVMSLPGSTVDGQWRCYHKKGGCRWMEGTIHNLIEEPGVKGLVLNYRDITDRKQSEETSLRLASIVENSDEAIIGKTLGGVITSWNKGAQRLYGYEEQDVLGESIEIIIPPEKKQELGIILQKLSEGQKTDQLETVRVTKDGRRIDVLLTVTPIKNEEGKYIAASAIAYDITERKRAQIALQESELRFRTMADTAPVMIWMSGADMLSTFFNKAWLDFRGKSIDYELGHGWMQGLHPEDVRKCWTVYSQSFDKREKFTMDYRLKQGNGEYRWILATAVPRFRSNGQFAGYIGSCIDITDLKLAEEVLKRDKESLEKLVDQRSKELFNTQKELKQATRLADIGTLAATVAHELRNPLGVIQMAAHNLKRKKKVLEEDKHLQNIEKKVWEGNRIIDNLLSYSRIKIPSYEKFSVFQILDECIGSTQSRFPEYKITVEKLYDPTGLEMIEADPYQIKEILVNILNNAFQAIPSKEGTVIVEARRIPENMVSISITDNGSGIDEEDLHQVFTPFFTRKSKGTGLGLTICNELVELHRGKIEIRSRKGEGTTIHIILPVTRKSNE